MDTFENNAFSPGDKLGGLHNKNQIKILLCFLINSLETPISVNELMEALFEESLVNVFEISDALSRLEKQELVILKEDGRYAITPSGKMVSEQLFYDVPHFTRQLALKASIRAIEYNRKKKEHKTKTTQSGTGYNVECVIEDITGIAFKTEIFVPNSRMAEFVSERFIQDGDVIFRCMLAVLTDSKMLIEEYLKAPPKEN